MAKKFGGKYSPDGSQGPDSPVSSPVGDDRKVDAAGAKATVLFVPGIVLAATSLNDGATALVIGLVGAAILTLAAWLTRDGLRAAAAYEARRVAQRPALPRKLFGSLLTGLGIATASISNDPSVLAAALFGIAAVGLHLAAFGIDPLKDKRMEGIDTFQQDRVAKVVVQAEGHMLNMRNAIAGLNDRALVGRVDGFLNEANRLIRSVEEDPRDLSSARKFLSVYLKGAAEATQKFTDLYSRNASQDARDKYEALLDDLQSNFAARTEKLLSNDQDDMEIQIKVLQDRLQREGV